MIYECGNILMKRRQTLTFAGEPNELFGFGWRAASRSLVFIQFFVCEDRYIIGGRLSSVVYSYIYIS